MIFSFFLDLLYKVAFEFFSLFFFLSIFSPLHFSLTMSALGKHSRSSSDDEFSTRSKQPRQLVASAAEQASILEDVTLGLHDDAGSMQSVLAMLEFKDFVTVSALDKAWRRAVQKSYNFKRFVSIDETSTSGLAKSSLRHHVTSLATGSADTDTKKGKTLNESNWKLIKECLPRLTHLSLAAAPCKFKASPFSDKLTKFSLDYMTQYADPSDPALDALFYQHLLVMPLLEEFTLTISGDNYAPLSSTVLRELRNMNHLRVVSFDCDIDTSVMQLLKESESLQEVHHRYWTPEKIEALHLKRETPSPIQYVDVNQGDANSDEFSEALVGLPNLTRLMCSHESSNLFVLSKLLQVTTLSLQDVDQSVETIIEHVTACTRLTSLRIFCAKLTDKDLERLLTPLVNLKSLYLSHPGNISSLAFLSNLPHLVEKLEAFNLYTNPVLSLVERKRVEQLRNLKTLRMQTTGMDAAEINRFKPLHAVFDSRAWPRLQTFESY